MSGLASGNRCEKPAEKTFLLGLGAQKAGTSWLHAYLSAAPNADMGLTKEYHVWDAIRSPLAAGRRLPLTPATLLRRRRLASALFQRWPSLYYRYFARLLGKPGTTLAGDITPSYCFLSAGDLAEIRERFETLGIRLRIIFLMRDPVDRCWSAARMNASRGRGRRLAGDALTAAVSLLTARYRNPQTAARTRYEGILDRIAASGVDSRDVYVGLYEELFRPATIDRLSEWLGVPSDPSFGEKKVFAAAGRMSPPDDLAAEVAAFYRETYAAVARRMPRVGALWTGFRWLAGNSRESLGRRTA